MKTFILFFSFFIFNSLIRAQENKLEKRLHFTSIGISFSADNNERFLKAIDPAYQFVIDDRDQKEISRFGYSTGVTIDYTLGKLQFETGVLYASKGFNIKESDYVSGSPNPNPNDPIKQRRVHSFTYIDIPIRILYCIGRQNWKFIPGIGIIPGFMIKNQEKAFFTYTDGHELKVKGPMPNYKKTNLSFTLSLGFQKQLNDKFYFRAEPIFRYGMLKLTDKFIAEYLWNIGLNFGCYYRIK